MPPPPGPIRGGISQCDKRYAPSRGAEARSKAIEEKVKRSLADTKALEKPPSWVDLTVEEEEEEEEVKPSRGSQAEGKH